MRSLCLTRVLLSCLAMWSADEPALAGNPSGSANAGSEKAISRVLDDWHAAASAADEQRYFGHFTPDAVFLGTAQHQAERSACEHIAELILTHVSDMSLRDIHADAGRGP